mmetsp:Transcript_23318/g.32680  ORF Transcript_23318/g.32680 Transcript_23318/m.32680 type:complete len:559 (+) Transcript_23318:2-1678(+)
MVLSDDTSNFSGLLHAVTRSSSWVAISSAESSAIFDEISESDTHKNSTKPSSSGLTGHHSSQNLSSNEVREGECEPSISTSSERISTDAAESRTLSSILEKRTDKDISPMSKPSVSHQKIAAREQRRRRSLEQKRGSRMSSSSKIRRSLDTQQTPTKIPYSTQEQNIKTESEAVNLTSSDASTGDILWKYDSIVQELLHRNKKLKEKVNAEDLSTCNNSAEIKAEVIDLRVQSMQKISPSKNQQLTSLKSRRRSSSPLGRKLSHRKPELKDRRSHILASREKGRPFSQVRRPPRPGDLRTNMSPTRQRRDGVTRAASAPRAQQMRFAASEDRNPSPANKRSQTPSTRMRSRSPVPEGPISHISRRQRRPRARSPAPEDLSPYTTSAKSLSKQLAVAQRTCNGIKVSHNDLSLELDEFKKKLKVHSCNKNEERALISASKDLLRNFQEKIREKYEANEDKNGSLEGWGDFEGVRHIMLKNLKLLNETQQAAQREQVRRQSPTKERPLAPAEEGEELLVEIERTLEELRRRELRNNDELMNCLEEAKHFVHVSELGTERG